MFVSALVPSCDFTDAQYPQSVQGAYALAQGATGRWCAVLFAGPEWLTENKVVVLSREEAIAKCEERGGSIDF